MFDLFRSREKSVRYLLGALLSLVALSMVITLIPGFGSGGGGSSQDQVVAEIGKEAIGLREVQMRLNDTLKAQQIPPELISMYVPQIVNQLVIDDALAFQARRMGFQVTDGDVAAAIHSILPQLYNDGKFVGKDMYAAFLAQQNLTIPEFERNMRLRVLTRKMENIALEGMVVTPQEVEKEFQAKNEKVALEYVAINPTSLEAEVKLTPMEIEAEFRGNRAMYVIPEKRTVNLLIIDEKKVAESLALSDDDLRKVYEANKDNFRMPERVHARHILLMTKDKPKEQVEILRKRAEDLLKQIKAGADFAELAKKSSDDTTSAVKGGDLDWFAKGAMVPEFEKVAFSLKPNEISDIVTSPFGFHIIQVLGKEDARLKPFEEVKGDIQKERQKQLVYDRMQALADQAKAILTKIPDQADMIAAQMKIQSVKAENLAKGAPFPVIGENLDLDDVVFQLPKGGVTDVIQTQDNRLVVASVVNIIPQRPAEFSEMQDQIRRNLTTMRAQRLLGERSQEVMAKIKEFGGDINKAAAFFKLTVKKAPEFGRDGSAEGIGSANFVEEAFRRDVGTVFGPIPANNQNFICKVVSKTPPDMSKLAEQRFDIMLRLKSQKARQRKDMFEDGLLTQLQKEGVVKLHKQTIQRLVESYKGS